MVQEEKSPLAIELEKLKPHQHFGFIYDSPSEWKAVTLPFIRTGLDNGHKCIYIADGDATGLKRVLGENGIDAPSPDSPGNLTILDESQFYTREGYFDPDRVIAFLVHEAQKALSEGYSALRITGEMSWLLKGKPGSERILEYEARINREVLPEYRCLILCQYERQKFDAETIRGVIMAHPSIVYGYRMGLNPLHIAADGLLSEKRTDLEVQKLLDSIFLDGERDKGKEPEDKYRHVFEASRDGIILADSQSGIIEDINPFLLDMLGYSREEITGKPIWEAPFFENGDSIRDCFRDLQKKNNIRCDDISLITRGGNRIYVEMVGNFYVSGGRTIVQCNIHDITRRKEAEAEKLAVERKAQMASRLASVGEMASGIAHEINNPLTGVIGFSELLLEKDLPGDIKKDVEIIHDGARRVADIVKRLLSFARQHKPQRSRTDINELIENSIALRKYALVTSNIEVTTSLEPNLPVTVTDAGQLQQVFMNIIVNAETEMKRAHGRGSLTVKTERTDDIIRVSFRDDGPGIAEENLEKIFNPFFTTREVGDGTGLGLSLSYGIIAEHNGKLYAKSRPGQGATFFIDLPVILEGEDSDAVENQKGENETKISARILVVDDEAAVLTFLGDLLAREGYDVETASSGEEAIEMVKEKRYSLILCDIKLPGLSGIEIYSELGKIATSLKKRIIFITGDVIGADTRRFIKSTRAPCITKPFNVTELKEAVRDRLARKA